MKILKTAANLAEKLCVGLCILLTIMITVSAFAQVFTRFLLGGAWKWTDEACRYCLVWLAMMGAALGVKRHAHLAIDVIVNRLPRALQQAISCISFLAAAAFGCALVYTGITLSKTVMQQKSAVMGLPMGIVYLAIPVFGAFLALFSFTDFWENVLTILGRPEKGGEK